MKKSKSVAERLQNIKLQTHLEKIPKVDLEEYPKLRKPKLATLQKIQAHNKSVGNIPMLMTQPVANTETNKNFEVPLRQEFLCKKEQLEKATTNFLKEYELAKSQGDLLDKNIFIIDSVKDQPLTLDTELDFQLNRISSNYGEKTIIRSFSDREQLLVNIIYTKVKAHQNGFFAENLPDWYKKTFDKDLILDWIEILEASNKFDIENIQNKIVLYAKEVKNRTNADLLNASLQKATINEVGSNEVSKFKVNNFGTPTESSIGFVRYKHLQKSLQEYAKDAGRNTSNDGM